MILCNEENILLPIIEVSIFYFNKINHSFLLKNLLLKQINVQTFKILKIKTKKA